MAWTDTILSKTAGVAFRAWSGNVDPWTVQVQKDQAAADIKRALGPKATPADVQAAQDRIKNEIDSVLKTAGAHPDQAAGVRLPWGIGVVDLPKIKKFVDGALVVLVVGGVLYFGVLYHKTIAREFRKLKVGR